MSGLTGVGARFPSGTYYNGQQEFHYEREVRFDPNGRAVLDPSPFAAAQTYGRNVVAPYGTTQFPRVATGGRIQIGQLVHEIAWPLPPSSK